MDGLSTRSSSIVIQKHVRGFLERSRIKLALERSRIKLAKLEGDYRSGISKMTRSLMESLQTESWKENSKVLFDKVDTGEILFDILNLEIDLRGMAATKVLNVLVDKMTSQWNYVAWSFS